MASRGRRRSILKPQNTNEQDPDDNGGNTEKLDTQTIYYLPLKRVSFSQRTEVKEFQNVSAEDRSNSVCAEPSIMDMTMQNPNVDDSIEGDNGDGAGVANMSMTCIFPSSGERDDKTFIENSDKFGKTMCMTFTVEQPEVIIEQQNRYRDATYVVGDSTKNSNFDMSFTRGVLDFPVEDKLHQQQQVVNNTRIDQQQQHYPSPDMSLTMSADSPFQQYQQQEDHHIPSSSARYHHTTTNNNNNDNNNENDASLLLSHHTNNNQKVPHVQQQGQEVPIESMMETTNFEDDDVFLPNSIHKQRNETCFEFATMPQNMSRTEIWESSKYPHQSPVNFEQTKQDFVNMSIEPSHFNKTVNTKISKSFNQTLGNFQNPDMSMTVNKEGRDINKTKASTINMNLEKTGLTFNPEMSMTVNEEANKTNANHVNMNFEQTRFKFNPNMSMTVNEEGYNFNTTNYNYDKDRFEKTSVNNNHPDMSVTNCEPSCIPYVNSIKINPAPSNFEETRLDKNHPDMSITIHQEATSAVKSRYTSHEDNFEETKLHHLDMSVTMTEATRLNHTNYDDRPILNLEQTRPAADLDMSVTTNEPLNKTQNVNAQRHANFNSTRQDYQPDMSATVNFMNESSDENKVICNTTSPKNYNSNCLPIVKTQKFEHTRVENLDMSETRFEEEEEEDATPIKKMTKLKTGHHKTNINNKDLEKTTIGYANMSITTNIPSSESLKFKVNNVQKRGTLLEQTQFFSDVSMTMDLNSKTPSQQRQKQHHRTIIQPHQEQEHSDMSMTMGGLPISSQQSEQQLSKVSIPFTKPVLENRNPMMMMASKKDGNTNTINNNNNNIDKSEPDSSRRKTYIIVDKNEIDDKECKILPPTSSIPNSSTPNKHRLPSKSDNRRSKIAVPGNSAFGRFGSAKTPRRKLPSDLFSCVPVPNDNNINKTPPTPTKIPVRINSPVKKRAPSSVSSLPSKVIKEKQGTSSNVKEDGKKSSSMSDFKTQNSSPSLELLPPTFRPKSNETNLKAKRIVLMGKDTTEGKSKADNINSPSVHENKKTVDSKNKYIHNLTITTKTTPAFTTTTTTVSSTLLSPPVPSSSTDMIVNKDVKQEDNNNLKDYSKPLKTICNDKNGILVQSDLIPETVSSSTIFTNSPGYNITLCATKNNYQKSNDIKMAPMGPIVSTTPTIFSPKTIERPIISASPFTISSPLQLADSSYSRGAKDSINTSVALDNTFSLPPLRPLPSKSQLQPQQQKQPIIQQDSFQIIVPVQSVKVREPTNKFEDPKKQRKEIHPILPIVKNVQNRDTTIFTSTMVPNENNSNDEAKNNSAVPLKDKIEQLKVLKGLRLQNALTSFSKNLQVLDDSSFDLVIKEITGFVNPNFIQAEQKIREYTKFMGYVEFPTTQSDVYDLLAFSKRKLAEIP